MKSLSIFNNSGLCTVEQNTLTGRGQVSCNNPKAVLDSSSKVRKHTEKLWELVQAALRALFFSRHQRWLTFSSVRRRLLAKVDNVDCGVFEGTRHQRGMLPAMKVRPSMKLKEHNVMLVSMQNSMPLKPGLLTFVQKDTFDSGDALLMLLYD